MVHALIATRRLLRPAGVLVDLRTDRFASLRARHDQLYCLTSGGQRHLGPLKIVKPLADFRAADRAVREVLRRGLFRLGAVAVVEIRSYFESLAALDKALARTPYAAVDDSTRRRLATLLRRYPAGQIMAIGRGRLTVLVKT